VLQSDLQEDTKAQKLLLFTELAAGVVSERSRLMPTQVENICKEFLSTNIEKCAFTEETKEVNESDLTKS